MSGKGKDVAFNIPNSTNNKPKYGGFQFSNSSLAASARGETSKSSKSSRTSARSKLQSAQSKFLTLIDSLDDEDFLQFREFIRDEMQFRTFFHCFFFLAHLNVFIAHMEIE